MRERLVIAFVGLTLAVIGLYGVPRAYYLADLVRDQDTAALEDSADLLAALIEERLQPGTETDEIDDALLRSGLVVADGIEWRPEGGGEPIRVGDVTDDPDAIVVTESATGGTLILTVSGDTVSSEVRSAVTPLVLIGLGLALGSAIFGFVLARRLSRPFTELAGFSRDLGHGRFDIDVPPYSVPEAEAIGASLRGAAAQLDGLVRREREFAANASHQLRTPITALRLSLEDLSYWPETAEPVREELERGISELDRLSAAIDEMLELARGRRIDSQDEVDLTLLVRACAQRWSRQLTEVERSISVEADGPALTRVPTGSVEQVLDVLVDNSRVHGWGPVTLECHDAGTHFEIAVRDAGRRQLRPDVFQRGVSTREVGAENHGIGLAVASELAEMCGGHLSLDVEAPTTRFVLWLPRRAADGSPTPTAPLRPRIISRPPTTASDSASDTAAGAGSPSARRARDTDDSGRAQRRPREVE